MAATVTFFIADILDPPPKNLSLHLSTEIIKLVSSATVQLSLGIVMNLLINESEIQSRMMVGGDHSSSFTSASSYLYSRNQSETSQDELPRLGTEASFAPPDSSQQVTSVESGSLPKTGVQHVTVIEEIT